MNWPKNNRPAWVTLALDDVAMTLAANARAPGARFDRVLPRVDLGEIAPSMRDFKSQLQIEFDRFLYSIADQDPDPEPAVLEWLISQWSSLADSPLAFRSHDGELVVVASRDIPSRARIAGLEDLVLLIGDEAVVNSEVTPTFIEWGKVEKKEQPFVWCGPFRLAQRGCSKCSNTKWKKVKPAPGLPQHTLQQVLTTTKAIKSGEVISCNFGIAETRQCVCETTDKKGSRRTWTSGGPGIASEPLPKPEKPQIEHSRSRGRTTSRHRSSPPATASPSSSRRSVFRDASATELVDAFFAVWNEPPTPESQAASESAEQIITSKRRAGEDEPSKEDTRLRAKKMRISSGGRRPRPASPLPPPTPSQLNRTADSTPLFHTADPLTPPYDESSFELDQDHGAEDLFSGTPPPSEMPPEAEAEPGVPETNERCGESTDAGVCAETEVPPAPESEDIASAAATAPGSNHDTVPPEDKTERPASAEDPRDALIAELQARHTEMEAKYTELEGKHAQVVAQCSELKAQVAPVEPTVGSRIAAHNAFLTAHNAYLSTQVANFTGHNAHLMNERAGLAAQNAGLAAQNADHIAKRAALATENAELKAHVDTLQTRYQEHTQRISELEGEVGGLRARDKEHVRQISQLKIRTRALLAANKQLQARGEAAAAEDALVKKEPELENDAGSEEEAEELRRSSSPLVTPSSAYGLTSPTAHRGTRRGAPVGMMIARKYTEETSWSTRYWVD